MKKKKEIVIKNLKYKVKVIQVSKWLLSLDFSFTVCSASSKKLACAITLLEEKVVN